MVESSSRLSSQTLVKVQSCNKKDLQAGLSGTVVSVLLYSTFLYTSFLGHTFGGVSKKYKKGVSQAKVQRFPSMLTPRSFIVLVCAFRSVTYFKLFFAYGTIGGIKIHFLRDG